MKKKSYIPEVFVDVYKEKLRKYLEELKESLKKVKP